MIPITLNCFSHISIRQPCGYRGNCIPQAVAAPRAPTDRQGPGRGWGQRPDPRVSCGETGGSQPEGCSSRGQQQVACFAEVPVSFASEGPRVDSGVGIVKNTFGSTTISSHWKKPAPLPAPGEPKSAAGGLHGHASVQLRVQVSCTERQAGEVASGGHGQHSAPFPSCGCGLPSRRPPRNGTPSSGHPAWMDIPCG